MKTTLKLSLLACSLALSLGSLAAATQPAPAASAPALAASKPAMETKANLRAAKARGELMSACQKKAAEQDLQQVERRQYLANCMAGT